jgi:hypothetical protein
MKSSLKNNYGYVLLFAIIVSSVVLSIAAFILSTSRKQFILTAAARDSTMAIYAADSGIECAVASFNQSLLMPKDSLGNDRQAVIYCGSGTAATSNFGLITGTAEADRMSFNSSFPVYQTVNPLQANLKNGTCVRTTVTVGKSTLSGNPDRTVIEARGYNLSTSGPCGGSSTHPRQVERAIQVVYNY